MTTKVTFSHFAICTSDLERSLRFYTEGLGFSLKNSIDELGPPFDTLTELPGAKLKVRQITCGNMMLELVGFIGADTHGSAERRPMNQRGLTHMTLVVENVEETMARIEEFGGAVVEESKVDSPFGPLVFCTDPDGVRIELMQPIQE